MGLDSERPNARHLKWLHSHQAAAVLVRRGTARVEIPAQRGEADRAYHDPAIESVTHDYMLDVAALAEPDTLFGMAPDWTSLNDADKAAVIAEVRLIAGDRPMLPIPSTALIAVAIR